MKRIALVASLAILLAASASAQVGDGRLTGGGSKELPKVDTMDPTALYKRAVEYIQARDYTRAVSLLRDVLARRDSDPASNYMMGIAQIGLNDLNEARRYLSTAISEKPDLAEALGRLSYVEARLGATADAQKHRADLMALQAKCAGACAEAAAIEAAITVAGAAAAKPAVSVATLFNQGIDALDAGKYAEADAAFGGVLAAKPDDWEAAYMRGQAQQALGDLAGARISFEAALRVQPGVVEARGRLGAVEKKLGNAQAAADLRAQLVQSQQRCGGTCSGARQIDTAIAMIDAPG